MASSQNDLYPSYEDLEVEVPSTDRMVREGQRLVEAGETEAGIRMWRQVLEIEPNNVTAIDLLNAAGVPLRDPRHAVLRKTGSHAMVTGSIDAQLPTIIVDGPPPSLNVQKKKRFITAALIALIALLALLLIVLPSGGSKSSVPETATPVAKYASSDAPASNAAGVNDGSNSASSKQSFYRVAVTTEPKNASISIDGRVIGKGNVSLRMPQDGKPHTLRVDATGFESDEVSFVDVAPPEMIVLARLDDRLDEMPVASEPKTQSSRRAKSRRVRRDRERTPPTSEIGTSSTAAKSTTKPTTVHNSDPEPTVEPKAPVEPLPKPEPSRVSPTSDNKDPWAN